MTRGVKTDTTGWVDKMLAHGREGMPLSRLCADVLKVPYRTYVDIRDRDENIRDAHEEYHSLCLAYWEEMGKTALETNAKFNTPLYKLFMTNKFGWSDRQEIDQKVNQKTTIEIVIGGSGPQKQIEQNEDGRIVE